MFTVSLLIAYISAEETAFEIDHAFRIFQTSVTWPWIGTYVRPIPSTNFVLIKKICGWTDGRTNGH